MDNMIKNNKSPLSRREFMKRLSTDLIAPWMEKRLEVATLKRSLRDNISQILVKPSDSSYENQSEDPEPKKRKYCAFCSYNKRECPNWCATSVKNLYVASTKLLYA